MGRACSTYGERRGAYRVLVENPRKGGYSEYPGVDGRIILKRIFKKWVEGRGHILDRSDSRGGLL
jgi:hypothetical protein